MSFFIDSGIFIGAFYEKDPYHKEAAKLFGETYGKTPRKCYTSVYVLDEFVSHLTGRARAADRTIRRSDYENIREGENAIQESELRLLQVTEEHVADAKLLYNKHWYLGLDLTDWTTVVLMEENGIGKLLSYDTRFDKLAELKEGYRIKRIF